MYLGFTCLQQADSVVALVIAVSINVHDLNAIMWGQKNFSMGFKCRVNYCD
jgi:hypothetical protein